MEALSALIPSGPWNCWQTLSHTRQIGMGSAGGIAPSEFEAWCRLEQIDDAAKPRWWRLISAMEREFHRFQSTQSAERERR